MANVVQDVFELREKIQGLFEWAKNNNSPLNSTRQIEKLIGINHATLFSNMEKFQMSQANQLALAKAYGFSVEWPEWRDPNETRRDARSRRRDTAEAFIAKFIAEKLNGARLTIAANPTWKHIDRRFADFALAVPTSYQPDTSANAIPLTVGLSFDRRGWTVLLDEAESILTIGLKQADLQLFYERASAKIDVFPLAHSNGMDANFCGDVEGLSPWWLINLAAGDLSWLAGRRVSTDGRDCVCHGFQAGDSIRAVMTARVSDCFVSVEGEVFEGLSPAKILLIRHLAKLSVLNNAVGCIVRTDPDSGEQVVSRHAAQLAERVRAVIASPNERFDALVSVAGLDPASDLRFGDWHGLDFSGADLRGFDFTGADLTGNRFDGTLIAGAVFDRASVERSSLGGAVDFSESLVAKPMKRGAHASNDDVAVELYVIADQVKRYPPNTEATGEGGYVSNLPLADLVEAVAKERDRRAFAGLYDHFGPRINAYLIRSGVAPATAMDLTQEVLTRLWLRAHQFDRNKSSVATWLFRIARNARIDHLRRQHGEPSIGEEALSVPDPSQAPDDAVSGLQWEERVRAAMTDLPPKQLAIVKLAFFDGLSHREIAHQTGLPLGTVKARIRLALARLRRKL